MAPDTSNQRLARYVERSLHPLFPETTGENDNPTIFIVSAVKSTSMIDSQPFIIELQDNVDESEWADRLRERITRSARGWITSAQVKQLALVANPVVPEGHEDVWRPACKQIQEAMVSTSRQEGHTRLLDWTHADNLKTFLDSTSFETDNPDEDQSGLWPWDEGGQEDVAEASRSQLRLHAVYQYLREDEASWVTGGGAGDEITRG